MTQDSLPPTVARKVRALRRAGLILLGLIGLVFLTVGGWLLASQSWDRATGTVQTCTARVERTTSSSGRTVHTCTVTWRAADGAHTGSVELDRAGAVPGRAVALRVTGDQAVVATPVWVGAASAAGGLALVGAAAVLLVRQRRARA
ncbi:DUF3592 domain-containing protein [Micromonospora krabiensis]|uniref:Uncharacterized protein n=1 Tax=Micromonospora krabiensis TaxID=307121 RepID=A0A1C3N173_9ACTN|nr:DUF3592 domain-containing protein [Micromonospora krabiensis]SBV26329.1 hypothetical protein GA0070620_1817 [Micromonospora krabiensis]